MKTAIIYAKVTWKSAYDVVALFETPEEAKTELSQMIDENNDMEPYIDENHAIEMEYGTRNVEGEYWIENDETGKYEKRYQRKIEKMMKRLRQANQ